MTKYSKWTQADIIEIGLPGKFDQVFGIVASYHEELIDPLYIIVDKSTLKPAINYGFMNPIVAEKYVKENREKLIQDIFEKTFLPNE